MKARWAPYLTAVMVAIVAPAAVLLIAPLKQLETRLQDIRVAAMQAAMPPSTDLAVIAIDEATLARFAYRSPIDRAFLADVITSLEAKGVRAVGVDVLIDQPTEAAKDDRLKQVIANAKVPVRFSFTASKTIMTPEQNAYQQAFVPPANRMEARLLTDAFDGTVRRINPGGEEVKGQRRYTPTAPMGFVPSMVKLSGGSPPTTAQDIAWRPRPDAENAAIPTFSALYLPFLPDDLLRGRTVLVGAVLSITDRHLTPLSIIDDGDLGHMPGVLVQAHGIAQFLEGRAAPVVAPAMLFGVSAAFAAAGVGISLLRRGIAVNVTLGAALLAAWWAGAILGYGQGLPMLPLLGPSMALAGAMWIMDLLIGRGERQQREFIQRTFSRYVSPAVVEELIRHPESAAVSGRRRDASFLFTDIAGFTTLSELLEPEALSDLLNAYLDGACTIVLRHQGTIDKFIGDAIMAVFNAPVEQADHADRAVRCALDLDAYAEQFRKDAVARGVPMGVTRIGIHRGEAVIGNFGSQSRMDFTALGDTVNTAARTEGVNKYFGTRVCCTQSIVDTCPERRFRKIGDIQLKGKLTATGLYVPIADTEDQALIGDYADAYDLLAAEAIEAEPRFAALLGRFPGDPLVRFHHERIVAGKRTTMVVMDDK